MVEVDEPPHGVGMGGGNFRDETVVMTAIDASDSELDAVSVVEFAVYDVKAGASVVGWTWDEGMD